MPYRHLPAFTALAAVFCLACPPTTQQVVHADDVEAAPNQGWVFNGKGQKTDRPAIVNVSAADEFYPIMLNNHWGLMNQNGQVVAYPEYDWTDYNFEGFTRVVLNGKTGFIFIPPDDQADARQYRIPTKFDYADRFSSGVAVVMIQGRWGMIDRTGKALVPLEFDGALRMQDGFAAVQKGELCGFVNRAGDLKIPVQYKRVRSFHNGFAAVQMPDDSWGYIDKRGKLVWSDKTGRVRELGDFHEQYARVLVAVRDGVDRWGYLSKRFRFHIDPTFEDARDFHDGIAAVKVDGKWGFIHAGGRWEIEPQFDDADDFDDAVGSNDFEDARHVRDKREGRDMSTAGLYAMIKLDGRWGYVDRRASRGLAPQFKSAEPFFRGLARVDRDDSFAYVTETGQVIWDPRVAMELGFVNQRAPEQARVELGVGWQAEPHNEQVNAPPPRQAFDVPYPPEYLYAETLPAPKR